MNAKVLSACVAAAFAAGAAGAAHAQAKISGDVVKIGVLTDLSGLYSDIGGQGSVTAAQMAVEDFGATVRRQEDRGGRRRPPEQGRRRREEGARVVSTATAST